MVDPVTNNRSLTLPTVGGDTGTWGTILNNAVITITDQLLGSAYTATVNVADVTLSTAQFQNAIVMCTGVLTGNRNLVIPISPNISTVACGGPIIVYNTCTGNFTLTVKTANTGSVGVPVPYLQPVAVYSDGTNVNYVSQGTPAVVQGVSGSPNGQLAGTAASTTQFASIAVDYAAGNLYLCTQSGTAGSAVWSKTSGNASFTQAANLALSASVGGNALTVSALAANTNTTPTSGNPITFYFQSATNTSGLPASALATAALSVSTQVGATLGSVNNTPFKFWIVAFLQTTGDAVLGLINCLNGTTNIFPLNSDLLQSSSAIGAGSTSAGVYYTGSAQTNRPIQVLGYVEYLSGLVTAGTYNNAPDRLRVFNAGMKLPGDVVRTIRAPRQALFTTTSSIPADDTIPQIGEGAQLASAVLTAQSPSNLVILEGKGQFGVASGGDTVTMAMFQGAAANALAANSITGGSIAASMVSNVSVQAGTTTGVTYQARFGSNAGNVVSLNGAAAGTELFGGVSNSYVTVTEIMA